MFIRLFCIYSFCFTLFSLDGQASFISSDSLLQKINHKTTGDEIIVINFWATWCRPCVEELPFFFQADTTLKSKSIQFIFVSFDGPMEMKKVKKFIHTRKINGTHYVLQDLDLNAFIDAVDPRWQGSIPYTIVLKKGVRKNHEFNFESLDDLLDFINN